MLQEFSMRFHWPVYRTLPIVLLVFLVGCGQSQPTAISIEDAKTIKSGSSLSEVNAVLGEPHEPTSIQSNAIDSTIARMPPPMQANANNDRRFAWGTDDAFLVAVVNDQDVAWIVSWQAGSPPPTMPSVTGHLLEPGHP
jgi:hypothetical protein